jgi:hypothetical protein
MDEQGPDAGELHGSVLPPNYVSRKLESSAIVKTGDGQLFGLTVTNTNAATQFLLGFDAQTLPGDGAVPLFAYKLPAADALPLTWIPGRTFFAGLILCNSSTQGSKTIGAADCLFDVQYL